MIYVTGTRKCQPDDTDGNRTGSGCKNLESRCREEAKVEIVWKDIDWSGAYSYLSCHLRADF